MGTDDPGGPGAPAASLGDCTEPLARRFDTVLLDLDGVVYTGRDPIDGAAGAVAVARAAGARVAFVTNNAAQPPGQVADRLSGLGVPARADDVVTSAQAAAALAAERFAASSPVLVVGGPGVVDALTAEGLRPVRTATDHPVAVVQGFHPDVDWRQLAEAAFAIRAGATWIATNADATLPTERGPAPGNGALVAALRHATGAAPVVAGKPEVPLLRAALRRTGARRALFVGDRLDTDVAGARAAQLPSLLVLTGVTDVAALLAAPPRLRPTFVAHTLAALSRPHPAPVAAGDGWRCGGFVVTVRAGETAVRGDGDPDDALRAMTAAWWAAADLAAVGAGQSADQAADRVDLPAVAAAVAALPAAEPAAS